MNKKRKQAFLCVPVEARKHGRIATHCLKTLLQPNLSTPSVQLRCPSSFPKAWESWDLESCFHFLPPLPAKIILCVVPTCPILRIPLIQHLYIIYIYMYGWRTHTGYGGRWTAGQRIRTRDTDTGTGTTEETCNHGFGG